MTGPLTGPPHQNHRIKLREDPPHLKADIRHNYDNIAKWYDRIVGVIEWLSLRRKRQDLIAKASGQVLEVAVGTGVNLAYYPPNVRIDAVDLSSGMMEIARRKADRLGLDVTFHEMDAESLSFPDDRFDAVVSTLSARTFPDPVAALEEMARVVRPGGKILLMEQGLSNRGWPARFQRRLSDKHFETVGCRWDREPMALVRKSGLSMETYQGFLLGMGHMMVLRPTAMEPDRGATEIPAQR